MKCNKVQDLILSDYLDDQMEEIQKKKIQQHLGSCTDCQNLLKIVKKTAFEPFADLDLVEPPEEIWKNIEHQIIQESVDEVSNSHWLNTYFFNFKFPFVIATICSVIFVSLIMFNQSKHRFVVQSKNEQDDFFEVSLLSVSDYYFDAEEDLSFGTSIEEYFL